MLRGKCDVRQMLNAFSNGRGQDSADPIGVLAQSTDLIRWAISLWPGNSASRSVAGVALKRTPDRARHGRVVNLHHISGCGGSGADNAVGACSMTRSRNAERSRPVVECLSRQTAFC